VVRGEEDNINAGREHGIILLQSPSHFQARGKLKGNGRPGLPSFLWETQASAAHPATYRSLKVDNLQNRNCLSFAFPLS